MKELKSKKTGVVNIYSDEEFAIIAARPEWLKKFIVTDLKLRPMVQPPLVIREIKAIVPEIKEKKTKIKKNEG